MRWATAAVGILVLAAAPAPLAAQPAAQVPSDAELEEARRLYVEGTQAAEDHRWEDAFESFRQSYALSGAGVALYSVAYTLRSLGRDRDARDTFDRLLRQHELEPDLQARAEELRDETAARVAVLSLTGLPERPRVRLDGERMADDGSRPLDLETDPGSHALQVAADGYEPFVWDGTVGPGERRSVDVRLIAIDEGGSPLTSEPVFWIAVGGAVAAAIAVVAVVQVEAQLDPTTDHHIVL